MEYGLRPELGIKVGDNISCLNPCFNGIWSATLLIAELRNRGYGLNPCFNGIWSATQGAEDQDLRNAES